MAIRHRGGSLRADSHHNYYLSFYNIHTFVHQLIIFKEGNYEDSFAHLLLLAITCYYSLLLAITYYHLLSLAITCYQFTVTCCPFGL
jgi:hypothetical protein